MTQGQRLEKWRKFRGFSRSKFADKCGVSRQTVLGWERGDWNPSDDRLPRIAEVLGFDVPQRTQIPVPPALRNAA